MKKYFFGRSRSDFNTKALMWGLGGVAIGAGVTYFLTSPARSLVTELIRGLFQKQQPQFAGNDDQLAEMENEGGVSHVVRPPSTSFDSSKA